MAEKKNLYICTLEILRTRAQIINNTIKTVCKTKVS